MMIAYPGVMWKSAILFLPLLWAGLAARDGGAWSNGLFTGVAIFLLLTDGSRTGLLLGCAMGGGLLLMCLFRAHIRAIFLRASWLAGLGVAVVLLMSLQMGLTVWKASGQSHDSSTSVVESLASSVATVPLALQRMEGGDADRLTLLRQGLLKSQACQPLGCGFGATASVSHGIEMPVHNAYLAALGDFGILGFVGMLAFVLVALWPLTVLPRHRLVREDALLTLAACVSALAFCVSLMLHTFTSEMSEWGYFILMLALSWSRGRRLVA